MVRRKTKEEFDAEFLAYAQSGGDLRSSKIKSSWRTHIVRNYGTYENLLNTLGYDFEDIHGVKKWSKQRVIDAIRERYENGESLAPSQIKKSDTSLRGACEVYFGNISTALEAAGFNAEEHQLLILWDKEKVKSEFTKYMAKHPNSCISKLAKDYKALSHAVLSQYGSYEALCKDLGIEVSVIKRQEREWSKEQLIDVLLELRSAGEPLNFTNVQTYFPALYAVSNRHFGGYENALAYIGEDLEDYVSPLNYYSHMGKKFERKLSEMFNALEYKYLEQKRLNGGTIMPDFIDTETGNFIDAKLSSWTLKTSDTAEKYLPHCDKLIIVYLRGQHIDYGNDRIELRDVSYYYPELKERGLEKYIDEFTEMQRELNAKYTDKAVA